MGNELGAGHPKSAAFSVVVANLVSFSISLVAAIVVLALRHVISYAFTEGEDVAKAVSELCPLLAISLILNGVQPVLSGILRPLLAFTIRWILFFVVFFHNHVTNCTCA